MRVGLQSGIGSSVGQGQREWQGCVGQGLSGRAGHGAWHVGHAVVDDAAHREGGVGVSGGLRGLEAATLVDGDVDNHRAGPHASEHVAGHQVGCPSPLDEHGADHHVGVVHRGLELGFRGVHGLDPTGEALGQTV